MKNYLKVTCPVCGAKPHKQCKEHGREFIGTMHHVGRALKADGYYTSQQ